MNICFGFVLLATFALQAVLSFPTDGIDNGNRSIYENPESLGLIEGDIIPFDEDRNVASTYSRKWPQRTVYYYISRDHNCKGTILSAMAEIAKKSCIKFRERRSEPDYVRIFHGQGCYSYVGRIGGAQKLSIGTGCCHKFVIQHEVFHALGFYHEHNRPDRDRYVRIYLQNVSPNMRYNFQIRRSNFVQLYGTKFDFTSNMIYGSYAFSKNGRRTMVKTNGGSFYSQEAMSASDLYRLNRHYCS